MPIARAVKVIEQVAAALEAAHELHIVHRDLKPENIMVADATQDDVVKVVDFGLARVAGQSRLTRPGVVFGTPHYMSPEQAFGEAVDRRSDVYALGIVMYEILSGRVPFEADTYMGVLTKHMYQAPTPPSEVVRDNRELGALEDMVLRCLKKKPGRRYQHMRELLSELHNVVRVGADGRVSLRPKRRAAPRGPSLLADLVEPPTRSELRRELSRFERRPRVRKSLTAIPLVAGLGAAFYWAFLPEPSPERSQLVQHKVEPATVGEVSVSRPARPVVPPSPVSVVESATSDASVSDRPQVVLQRTKRSELRSPPPKPVQSVTKGIDANQVLPQGSEPADSQRTPQPDRQKNFRASEIVDPWSN